MTRSTRAGTPPAGPSRRTLALEGAAAVYLRACMASPASVPPAPLEQLGEFTLRSVLGRGASGTVFAAWSARHTEVALKVLHAELARSERERRRFFAEVERMRRVRHPCLVALVDAGSMPDGRPYLCMPLLLGETLASRVARGPLPLDAALDAFAGLADGLGALHDGSLDASGRRSPRTSCSTRPAAGLSCSTSASRASSIGRRRRRPARERRAARLRTWRPSASSGPTRTSRPTSTSSPSCST